MDDMISRQAAIDALDRLEYTPGEWATSGLTMCKDAIKELPSAQPGCEDAVPRTSVEYICRKNTVSTNPYEHKYHDKFFEVYHLKL